MATNSVEQDSKKAEKKQNESPDSNEKNQLHLMKSSFNFTVKKQIFNCLKNELGSTIGLRRIGNKFDSYNNIDEFMVDIKQLVKGYSVPAQKNEKMKKALNLLLKTCERDASYIKNCAECFQYWISGEEDFFEMACSKPHLLVFAKFKEWPPWPGKVMEIYDNSANIEFFGEHTEAEIPLESCFLYFEGIELENCTTDAELVNAIKDFKLHIENIKARFGAFNPAPGKITLGTKSLKQHLLDMFPNSYKDDSSAIGEVEAVPVTSKRKRTTEVDQGSDGSATSATSKRQRVATVVDYQSQSEIKQLNERLKKIEENNLALKQLLVKMNDMKSNIKERIEQVSRRNLEM